MLIEGIACTLVLSAHHNPLPPTVKWGLFLGFQGHHVIDEGAHQPGVLKSISLGATLALFSLGQQPQQQLMALLQDFGLLAWKEVQWGVAVCFLYPVSECLWWGCLAVHDLFRHQELYVLLLQFSIVLSLHLLPSSLNYLFQVHKNVLAHFLVYSHIPRPSKYFSQIKFY
jgi:hypothetical protein